MATKKYELTEETKVVDGVTLHRVRALVSFGEVGADELGGWVESEDNLSQEGAAWVSNEACIYGKALVYDNAVVYSHAQVYGNAKVYGDSWVSGEAQVYDNAQVYCNACVSVDAHVFGDARVHGSADICGKSRVTGTADVQGYTELFEGLYGGRSMDKNVKDQNLRDLMDFYADVWECFPKLLEGMTNAEILDKLMKFANLTEDDLDVTLALEKIQCDLDIDKFYDELEAEGIEV